MLKVRGDGRARAFQIEKYVRYMQPFAVILLTLLGVLVSSKKSREGMGFLIAIGFLLAFLYAIFFTLSSAMAEAGSLPMVLGVWLPNIIFAGVAFLIYRLFSR